MLTDQAGCDMQERMHSPGSTILKETTMPRILHNKIQVFLLILLFIILALLITACDHAGNKTGEGSSNSTTTTDQTSDSTGAENQEEPSLPTQIPLEIRLAADFSESQYVGTEGGSLQTVDKDGVIYQLDLPPGALITPAIITLTPLESVGDFPLSGGLNRAVEILPQGQDLVLPAVLTITPTENINTAEAIPFGYTGDGGSFFLIPALDLGVSFQTQLTHFSVYGYGSGTEADLESLSTRQAAKRTDNFSQDAAIALRDSFSDEGELEPDEAAMNDITALLITWWLDDVRPALIGSINSGSIEIFTGAVNQYLTWQKQVQIMEDFLNIGPEEGYFDKEQKDGWELIETAFENIRIATISACVDDHDLRALNVLFRLERIADILGLPSLSVSEVFDRCLRFQLIFEGEMTMTASDYYKASMVVNTSLDLEFPSEEGWPVGIAAVGENESVIPVEKSFEFSGEWASNMAEAGCPTVIIFDESDEGYWYALLDLDWQAIEESGQPQDLTLALGLVGPSFIGEADCISLYMPYAGWYYFEGFQLVSPGEPEIFYGELEGVHRGWKVMGGETYATKSIKGEILIKDDLIMLIQTDINMILRHNPSR